MDDPTFQVLKWPVKAPLMPLDIPGRKVVMFEYQNGTPTIWTEVVDGDLTTMPMAVFPTGFPIIDDATTEHVASCTDGDLVWHLYRGSAI